MLFQAHPHEVPGAFVRPVLFTSQSNRIKNPSAASIKTDGFIRSTPFSAIAVDCGGVERHLTERKIVMTTSLFDIAIKTLEQAQKALTSQEIWDKSEELGTRGGFETKGKTIAATIGAVIYRDISKNGERSPFYQASKYPTKFYLTKDKKELAETPEDDIKEEFVPQVVQASTFTERDLHPLLAYFIRGNPHFLAQTKTILHEHSERKPKGTYGWLFPDVVGVSFPFDGSDVKQGYEKDVMDIQRQLAASSVRLYSFEMKKELNMGNLRESYFQAVSNSSWAHEGYLVAVDIDWEGVREEYRRLNKAFGIGLIRLDVGAVDESEILFPSRIEESVDWDTVNRIAVANRDFRQFLGLINDDIKIGKVTQASEYDKVYSDEEMARYILEKKINAAQK